MSARRVFSKQSIYLCRIGTVIAEKCEDGLDVTFSTHIPMPVSLFTAVLSVGLQHVHAIVHMHDVLRQLRPPLQPFLYQLGIGGFSHNPVVP